MKEIRLQQTIEDNYTFEYLLQLYKDVKKTRNIHKILVFKSFIARVMEAQWEYDENGRKAWASLEAYIKNVIMREPNSLNYLLRLAENEHPFGYKLKRDLRKTL